MAFLDLIFSVILLFDKEIFFYSAFQRQSGKKKKKYCNWLFSVTIGGKNLKKVILLQTRQMFQGTKIQWLSAASDMLIGPLPYFIAYFHWYGS